MRRIALLVVGLFFAGSVFADDSGNNTLFSVSNNDSNGTNTSTDTMVPPIVANSGGSSQQQSIGSNLNRAQSSQFSNDNAESSMLKQNKTRRENKISDYDPFVSNVYIRTGLSLKKYGSNLFQIPDSFAPDQNIPVPSNYVVGPGDSLKIQSWGAVDGDTNARVSSNGTIFIPKLGEVPVTGVRSGELDSYLKKRLGKIYRNFDVAANVSKVRSIQVTVAGMASQPGTYTLSSLSTLSNAIMAVGGPSGQGSMRDIELKRHGVVVDHFDLYDLLIRGNNAHDVQVLAGDVIVFKPLGNEVALYDGVKRPAIYEIKLGETVRDLIAFAGGYSNDAKTDRIVIETIGGDKAISVNSYATSQALNFGLSDGEIIHFFRTTNKYENSVAVIGNVVDPTRTGYREGMTVRDLIPNKEVLLTRSYFNSFAYNTYGRDNALTQKGIQRATDQAQDDGLSMGTGLKSGAESSYSGAMFTNGQNLSIAGPVYLPEADINWNYALIIRVNPDDYSTHVIPFNLRKAIAGNNANNIKLKPGDIINVLSAKEVRVSQLTKPIHVFVDGEVNSPGVYELHAGQTLKDVIESAGGVSAKAYVFGLELNRNSVKKQQTAALNQMLDQAQQSILAQSTSFANVTSSDQAIMQQMAVQQQMALINKMREIKPTGRIVLNLQSGATKINDLPNFKLENGDTVYIPPIPDTINVIGQVYNPATFIYNSDYTVGKYINLAGTENQYADTSVEYVLRADGTLYSKQQAGWFGSFSGRTLNPGDVIIVPQQAQIGGTMQNLLNWTQVLSNFGTAAAAITVFKN